MGRYRFRVEGWIEAKSGELAAALANAVFMRGLNWEAVPDEVHAMLETLNPQFRIETTEIVGEYVDSSPETE